MLWRVEGSLGRKLSFHAFRGVYVCAAWTVGGEEIDFHSLEGKLIR